MKVRWYKFLGTLLFFMGTYVRVETMFIPRTISLSSFLLLIIYLLWTITSI